ncbi:MAG: hypothetical protein ACLSAH_09595 [Bilophila wadsworthia]
MSTMLELYRHRFGAGVKARGMAGMAHARFVVVKSASPTAS